MSDLTITRGFLPAQLLNANERGHWAKRHRREQYWRQVGFVAVRAERAGMKWHDPRWALFQRARIDVWFRFPTNHRRDTGNLMPTAKHFVDGMVLAGLLLDDSDTYLDGPHLHREMPNGPCRLRIEVTALARDAELNGATP